VNILAGAKISIVSHKVQTTRARIRAIAISGETQIVFVDTPGIFAPRRKLDEAMVEGAWAGAGEADCVVLLVDAATGLTDDVQRIIDGLKRQNRKATLALNKVDLIKRETLFEIAEKFNAAFPFDETFMISALSGSGVEKLKEKIAARMPEGAWLYPEDQTADVSLRFMAAEITREKIYERLHQELPYSSTVETEAWQEQKNGSVRIEQVIYVQRDSQKSIVLGEKGQQIKTIGELARKDMEKQFERRVHLFLFVKVRENWMEDPERLRAMGLKE
jgi:GTPase